MATTDERSKLHAVLKKFDTAMLVTLSSDGEAHARPMAIAGVDDDCTTWFVTSRSSPKADEVAAGHRAQVVCQNGSTAFLSLSGDASVIQDRTKLDRLWKKAYEVWFPKGKDDPDLTLLRISPDRGEYWDETGMNKLQYAFRAAKAFATGTRPAPGGRDEHGKVKL